MRNRHSAGGSYGYVVVAASFLVQGTIVGALFAYSVFFDALSVEFGWSRALLSGAASLASLLMGVWAMVLGGLNDRLGPRAILSAAAVLMSLGYALMSRMEVPWHLYIAYPLFVGVAFGAHDVVTLSSVARWFNRQRGQMSGIVKTGTSTGQVAVPPAVAFLIAAFGWRSALIWMAVVLGPLVAVAAQFMRMPHNPEDHDNRERTAQRAKQNLRAGRDAMRTPAFRWICAAQFAAFFCMPTVIVHIVPYATDMGLSRSVAATVLSTIGAVSAVGRLTAGRIIDRVGARRVLILCYAIMFVSFVMLQFAYTPILLFAFALVYGLAHGGAFTSVAPLVAEFFGTGSHGQLFGTVLFVGTISGAIGPVVAGGAFDLIGTYRPVFFLFLVMLAFAMFVMGRLAAYEQG